MALRCTLDERRSPPARSRRHSLVAPKPASGGLRRRAPVHPQRNALQPAGPLRETRLRYDRTRRGALLPQRPACSGEGLRRGSEAAGLVANGHDAANKLLSIPLSKQAGALLEGAFGKVSGGLTVLAEAVGGAGDLRNGVAPDIVVVTRSARAVYGIAGAFVGGAAGVAVGTLGGPVGEGIVGAAGAIAGGKAGEQAGSYVGGAYGIVRSRFVPTSAGPC